VTNDLATLLNTEVARRFGRPTLAVMIPNFVLVYGLHDANAWFWKSNNDAFPFHARQLEDLEAAALWESHLLDQCGEHPDTYWGRAISWEVRTYHATDPDEWWVVVEYDGTDLDGPATTTARAPTRLEALARAMLAVPEPAPPTTAADAAEGKQ